jgi:hypothetical protein
VGKRDVKNEDSSHDVVENKYRKYVSSEACQNVYEKNDLTL